MKGAKQRMADKKAKAINDITDSITDLKANTRDSGTLGTGQLVAAPPLKEQKKEVVESLAEVNQQIGNVYDYDLEVDNGLCSFFGSRAL